MHYIRRQKIKFNPMSPKFQNKYRIDSTRLEGWNYAAKGSYFITICTDDRVHYFGEIENEKMIYSPIGSIAYVLWDEIRNHQKNIRLGEFVIMPNHVHGILILDGSDMVDVVVDSFHETNLQQQPKPEFVNEFMSSISPIPGSVSTIIRSYKSAVTKYCNRLGLEFKWQSRFYDHIIRNETSFNRISNYIRKNTKMWGKVKLFKG